MKFSVSPPCQCQSTDSCVGINGAHDSSTGDLLSICLLRDLSSCPGSTVTIDQPRPRPCWRITLGKGIGFSSQAMIHSSAPFPALTPVLAVVPLLQCQFPSALPEGMLSQSALQHFLRACAGGTCLSPDDSRFQIRIQLGHPEALRFGYCPEISYCSNRLNVAFCNNIAFVSLAFCCNGLLTWS